MLDPATARLCVWRLPLEAAFRLFSKLGSLGGSIRERFSRTGRTRPALARPAFSRWLLENDRLRERWPCQWLNVLYFPFSETSPTCARAGFSRPALGPSFYGHRACSATAARAEAGNGYTGRSACMRAIAVQVRQASSLKSGSCGGLGFGANVKRNECTLRPFFTSWHCTSSSVFSHSSFTATAITRRVMSA